MSYEEFLDLTLSINNTMKIINHKTDMFYDKMFAHIPLSSKEINEMRELNRLSNDLTVRYAQFLEKVK